MEKALAEYLGVPYISLFTNGTLPLITALQALRITGEVITTPYSFVATTHSLWWNGIKPVFVDVDEKTGIPFISGKDVSNEIIDWSDLRYIPKALHEELYARLAPQIDDILLSKNGARLGKAAIVETNMIFDIYVTLALLRPNKKIIFPKYLWRVINSPSIQLQIQNHLTGIGMPNLHLRDIKALSMFVPTLPEQVEIVRILDIIIEKENKAKQAAEAVLEQIDLLKKSILARAFRGEL